MKFRIMREWDDATYAADLGTVALSLGLPAEEVQKIISNLWDDFEKTHPESDNEFIGYLCDRGFEEVRDDTVDVYLQ